MEWWQGYPSVYLVDANGGGSCNNNHQEKNTCVLDRLHQDFKGPRIHLQAKNHAKVRTASCNNRLKEVGLQAKTRFSSSETDRELADYAKGGSTVWRLEFQQKCEGESEHPCVETSSKKGKKLWLSPGEVGCLFFEPVFKHTPERRWLKSQAERKWNWCWKFLNTIFRLLSQQYSQKKSIIWMTSLCVSVHTQLWVCIRV